MRRPTHEAVVATCYDDPPRQPSKWMLICLDTGALSTAWFVSEHISAQLIQLGFDDCSARHLLQPRPRRRK